ncbi:MAG: phage tail spike protein, partial [Faecousia sp.]
MIPVLFKANATKFNTFGIGVLKDCISCEVTEERNGAFECELKYPLSGALYKELATERLIKAKPNDTAKDQMFRIYRISTPIDGVVTVYAQHLSYDLSNIAALQWSEESISPALAMERVFANTATPHGFTCQTDYSAAKPFAVTKPQSVRACLGGVAGSFIDLWGGEFEWDNFNVIHHQGRGNHTGVVIEYGKNLTDMEHDDDNTDVYTDLLPYAVSTAEDGTETVITLAEVLIPVVETTLVQRKTYIKDFSEYFDMEETITEEALRAKANNYVDANPLGIGKPSITVAFEPLWKQPEYAAVLERVSLCDTVTVRHSVLGITAKAKVITTRYDTLAEKYISIELGSAKANLLQNVSSAQNAAEQAAAKVDRFPALMNSAIAGATDLITGQTGGYVVINTDGSGKPDELR